GSASIRHALLAPAGAAPDPAGANLGLPSTLRFPQTSPFARCRARLYAEEGMAWTIDDARELYNIEGWGIGYFDINEKGHVTVHPTKEPGRGLDLFELAM